jgi:hypothetical protein
MSRAFERSETHISAASKLKTAGRFLATTARHPEGAISLITGWGDAPIGCSIDVTPNCPLRCSHCYLYGKEYQTEGVDDDDEFMQKVSQFLEQFPSARTHLTAVGGGTNVQATTSSETGWNVQLILGSNEWFVSY